MPPASSFTKTCKEAKIPVPAPAARITYLTDAGILAAAIPTRDHSERCAALAWARDALAKDVDPDTWLTTLAAPLHPILLSLYALPPYKGAAPTPSDIRRLADIVATYTPDDGIAGNAPPQPPPGGINIQRPDGGNHPPVPGTAGGAGPSPPMPDGGTSGTTPPAPSPLKRKWLMHAELIARLPGDAYTALDSSAGMDTNARAKLQRACRDTDLAQVLDYATSAAFAHQTTLALPEGAHFDPLKRGLALAGVGRSAAAGPGAPTAFSDNLTRDTYLLSLRTHWAEMRPSFCSTSELSSTDVNRLWAAVTFVLTIRAARAMTWGVAEVAEACQAQLDALPAYRSAVSVAITRAAATLDRASAALAVNKSYLTFLAPFWLEHVLERARLTSDEVVKAVKDLMTPEPAPALPAPAPTPGPAPVAPPPAHVHPWPYLPPPTFYPQLGPPGYPPYQPPAQGGGHAQPPPPYQAPPPATTPTPPPRAAGTFVGKPISPLIVGKNFGLAVVPPGKPCPCAVSAAFPGQTHRTFECPVRYWHILGSCPGWTAAGARVPAAWNGDNITPACQAEWRTFAATLPAARAAGTSEVQF